jgi:hypothetical protein
LAYSKKSLQNLLQIELGSILELCLPNNKKYLREGVRTWKLRRRLCLGFQAFLETNHKQMKNSPSKKISFDIKSLLKILILGVIT